MRSIARVLIVDDHELIRQGLSRAFERYDGFAVTGEADSVGSALQAARTTRPDIVVTDVRLPDGTGLDIVRRLRRDHPTMGLIVLTMYAGDDQLFAAMESGASAFVPKDAPADDVVTAARHSLVSPQNFTAPNLADAMRRRMHETRPSLSQREREVLSLMADGLGVAAIARKIYVSESTTKTHISKIYDKLGVANRAQAIMAAVRAGLISDH